MMGHVSSAVLSKESRNNWRNNVLDIVQPGLQRRNMKGQGSSVLQETGTLIDVARSGRRKMLQQRDQAKVTPAPPWSLLY
jgi:hypothetical protein